jgi:hypothetical protein
METRHAVSVAPWVNEVARLHVENKDTKASFLNPSDIYAARRAEYLVKDYLSRVMNRPIEKSLDLRIPGRDTRDDEVSPNRWHLSRADTSKTYLLSASYYAEVEAVETDIPRYGMDVKSGQFIRDSELAKARYIVWTEGLRTVGNRWQATLWFATREDIESIAHWLPDKGHGDWDYTHFANYEILKPLSEF